MSSASAAVFFGAALRECKQMRVVSAVQVQESPTRRGSAQRAVPNVPPVHALSHRKLRGKSRFCTARANEARYGIPDFAQRAGVFTSAHGHLRLNPTHRLPYSPPF